MTVPKNPSKLKYCNWKVIICYLTFKNNLIMTKNHDIGISYFCKSDRVCFESWIKVWHLCNWLTYGHKSMYIAWCILSSYVFSIYHFIVVPGHFSIILDYSEAQHQECTHFYSNLSVYFSRKIFKKSFQQFLIWAT